MGFEVAMRQIERAEKNARREAEGLPPEEAHVGEGVAASLAESLIEMAAKALGRMLAGG
ncbi:hypothetical protein [Actinacidiphila yeochonensis]|uniref:hypothetical protein n=1 Tax=Actinacidiphila yeochonensis TaxID=89050 RepID=UPI000AEC0C93|nr:hypothetical protein [Actinacidiphila yeochonensis]